MEFELENLLEFLSHWNNETESSDNGVSRQINVYNVNALMVGMGFTLKWYISRDNFENIKNHPFVLDNSLYADENRIIMCFDNDDRVEIEVENFGVLDKVKEMSQNMSEIINRLDLKDAGIKLDLENQEDQKFIQNLLGYVHKELHKKGKQEDEHKMQSKIHSNEEENLNKYFRFQQFTSKIYSFIGGFFLYAVPFALFLLVLIFVLQEKYTYRNWLLLATFIYGFFITFYNTIVHNPTRVKYGFIVLFLGFVGLILNILLN